MHRSKYPPWSQEMRHSTTEPIRKAMLMPRAFDWFFSRHHKRVLCTLAWKLVIHNYCLYCNTIWQFTFIPGVKSAFLIGWFFGELFSSAQVNLTYLNIFCSGYHHCYLWMVFQTKMAQRSGAVHYFLRHFLWNWSIWTVTIQQISLLDWPLVLGRHIFLGIFEHQVL